MNVRLLLPAVTVLILAGCLSSVPGSYPQPIPFSRMVTVDDMRIRLLDSAPEGRPTTLLCVHGWGGTACDFLTLAEELAPEVRVVAPDLPGTGLSQTPPDDRYDLGHFISVIESLHRSLDLGQTYIVGHSMGAKLVLHYLDHLDRLEDRRAPRVDGLILLSPYGLEGQEGRLRAWAARRGGLVRFAMRINKEEYILTELRQRIFYDADRIDARITGCQVRSQLSEEGREAMTAVTISLIGRHPVDEILPRIELPTLVVWGQNDKVLDPEDAEVFLEALPNARLVLVPRCGHMPMVEQSARTAEMIRAFL